MASVLSQTLKDVLQYSKSAFGLFVLTAFIFSSFLLINQTAQAQLICPERAIIQITDVMDSADVNAPSINADGTRTVFDSDGDLLGQSGGNNQVYLYDSNTNQLTQITPASSSSANASINADGTLIALGSDMNINGGNPDGNDEIFLLDTTTGIFTQITFTVGASNFGASINADGTRIAFNSNGNINGVNVGGNQEIYLFDTMTSTFTQVTNEVVGASVNPSINADGTRIAFDSPADINGGNPEGNREVYLYDTSTMLFTQITSDTSEDSRHPSINANGTRIAFDSTADINGGNPEGNREVYLYNTTTGMISQITSEPAGFSGESSINADGTRIAFESSADINGGNPDGNTEVYIFDTIAGVFTQITDQQSGDSFSPALNADGTRIAFDSTSDLTGDNPDEHCQLFIQTCFDPNAPSTVPTLSEWGLIAMASILGIVGFMVARRRKVTA